MHRKIYVTGNEVQYVCTLIELELEHITETLIVIKFRFSPSASKKMKNTVLAILLLLTPANASIRGVDQDKRQVRVIGSTWVNHLNLLWMGTL